MEIISRGLPNLRCLTGTQSFNIQVIKNEKVLETLPGTLKCVHYPTSILRVLAKQKNHFFSYENLAERIWVACKATEI